LDLRVRTIGGGEELKHQRNLMLEGFKRFEQVEPSDKRFEQVDKRFDQQHTQIRVIHNEIKQLMRWGFGTLLALASLVVAFLQLSLPCVGRTWQWVVMHFPYMPMNGHFISNAIMFLMTFEFKWLSGRSQPWLRFHSA
jgi:hypothetical protein